MGRLWHHWFRHRAAGADTERPPTDPRAGTNVAVAMPILAGTAAILSARAGTMGLEPVGVGATIAFAVLAAVLGRYPLVLGPRTMYALETPTVLLAGLLGGPLVGGLVGAGSGLGDVGGVWRRRATYSGLACLQGIAAGHAGLAWQEGRLGLLPATLVGAAGTLVVGVTGLALVQLDRGGIAPGRLLWSASTDIAGLSLSIAPVALLAVAYADQPVLTLASTASVAATAVVVTRFGEQREAAAGERHEALIRDWLTGAASRAFFEVELERAREGVLRGAHAVGLVIVDADRFKDVNDTYGHTVGDGVLCELVRRIEGVARAGDLVARWGGEEFCVLAPGIATVDELMALAERIRLAVADAPFEVAGEMIPVTVSAGGTLVDGSMHGAAAFDFADRALYRAKQERNATCVLAPPTPSATPIGVAHTAGV